MELDKRIKEGKRPLFCLDTEEAKQFIGKEGYFTNHLGVFAHIRRIEKYMLTAIDEKAQSCFKDVDGVRWDWFLPTEWVKPEEPEEKYRPYTFAEWVDQHEIGEVITFRNRQGQEFHVMYTGYIIDNGEDIQDIRTTGRIMLINIGYFLENLFEDYEICINGEWQPFGIIDE